MTAYNRQIFDNAIKETQRELQEKPEWKKRYIGYANEISNNLTRISSEKRKFNEWKPLRLYINVSNAKKGSGKINFELRYQGQTVADLICKDEVKLNTRNHYLNNRRDFGCDLLLENVEWKGSDAKRFRDYFKGNPVRINESPIVNREHRIQCLFLDELLTREDKLLNNIKPVTVGGIRFPMPTPLKASNHSQIGYSGNHGGGIDILARTGTGGRATKLCILELKDENNKKEPPEATVKQALIYATFIRELLRSESGQDWWRLFGFGGKVPQNLNLYAACVMPSNENNDYSFKDLRLNINEDVHKDIIILHHFYFKENNGRITSIETSLPINWCD